jgi:hypothetical protein
MRNRLKSGVIRFYISNVRNYDSVLQATGDIEGLTTAVRGLTGDVAARARCGSFIRRRVMYNYAYPKVAEQQTQVYESVPGSFRGMRRS